MFAHKLAALVGERGDRQRDPPSVHKAFSNYLSHYYLWEISSYDDRSKLLRSFVCISTWHIVLRIYF